MVFRVDVKTPSRIKAFCECRGQANSESSNRCQTGAVDVGLETFLGVDFIKQVIFNVVYLESFIIHVVRQC